MKSYRKQFLFLFIGFLTCIFKTSCTGCNTSSNRNTVPASLKFEQLGYQFDSETKSMEVIFSIKNDGSNSAEKLQLHYKNISQGEASRFILLNNNQEATIDLPTLEANSSTGKKYLKVSISELAKGNGPQPLEPTQFQFALISSGQVVHTQNLIFAIIPIALKPLSHAILAGDKETEFKFKIEKQKDSLVDFKDIKLSIASTDYNDIDIFLNKSPFVLSSPFFSKELESRELQKIADLDQKISLEIKPDSTTTIEINVSLYYCDIQVGKTTFQWFTDNSLALMRAIRNEDVNLAQEFIAKGANVNIHNSNSFNKETPLHMATTKKEMVEMLCKAGADVNAQDAYRNTPLHLIDNIEILNTLLVSGKVDPNIKNSAGFTPIQKALDQQKLDTFRALLENCPKMDINVTNKDGKSLILEALGHIDRSSYEHGDQFVQLLLNDTRTDLKTYGPSLLFEAANTTKGVKIVHALLDKGVSINSKNEYGNTALHLAARRNNQELVLLLLQKGADKEAKNNKGRTPLHDAVDSYNSTTVAELLLQAGSDVAAKDNDDRIPLFYATTDSMTNLLIKYMSTLPIQIKNSQDKKGKTVLHYAVIGCNGKMNRILDAKASVQALIDAKIDLTIEDNNGKKAADLVTDPVIRKIFNNL